jgi:hypothetical protein
MGLWLVISQRHFISKGGYAFIWKTAKLKRSRTCLAGKKISYGDDREPFLLYSNLKNKQFVVKLSRYTKTNNLSGD